MTVSDQKTETWKPIPGAGYYEASDRGHIRSVDRTIKGRFHKGVVLKLREDGDGYWVVNITLDDGTRKHNASVARLVLAAHDPAYREELQACHGPGGQKDNRWPENIRVDTPDANREEALAVRLANNPPKVKPPKVCPRCGAEHAERGKNCRACFEGIGVKFARMLADGVPPEKAAEDVDYPLNGALNLAVRYGGLRFYIETHWGVSMATGEGKSAALGPQPRPWLQHRWAWPSEVSHDESQRPLARRLRSVLFRRGASRQNSDGA